MYKLYGVPAGSQAGCKSSLSPAAGHRCLGAWCLPGSFKQQLGQLFWRLKECWAPLASLCPAGQVRLCWSGNHLSIPSKAGRCEFPLLARLAQPRFLCFIWLCVLYIGDPQGDRIRRPSRITFRYECCRHGAWGMLSR